MNNIGDLGNSVKCINDYADSILLLLETPLKQVQSDDARNQLDKVSQHTQQLKSKINAMMLMIDAIPEAELKQIRHDMRNHINSIIGYSEILIEDNSQLSQLQNVVDIARLILQEINKLQSNVIPAFNPLVIDRPEQVDSADLALFKSNFSILIVDDIHENCQLLENLLMRSGYKNIRIAYDAIEAKQVLKANLIDLVLLDIDMPGMTGIELLQDLQQEIEQLHLMVIMVTGSDTVENAIQCIKLGAEDFLTKPIHTEMLRVRIGASLRKKWFLMKQKEYAEHIEIERKRYEDLLKAIFPPTIVTELSETGNVIARSYNNVSMLFCDVVGFTQYCDTHNLDDAIQGIQDFSAICEAAASKYNLQKIKTIGDGFLAIAGMLTEHENPVLDCILTAMEILENTKHAPNQWLVRAGIDFGTIIGGVVGHRQYLFDIWGDSVNTAARAQSAANPDRICLTARAWETVQDVCEGHSLGVVSLKGKGVPVELYEVDKIRVISQKNKR